MSKTKTKAAVKVGYWRLRHGDGNPPCRPQKTPAKGHKDFLTALCRLEYRLKPTFHNKYHRCLECFKRNGSGEYTHAGFVWPTGLYHYVKAHNVRVPQAFVDMVLEEGK